MAYTYREGPLTCNLDEKGLIVGRSIAVSPRSPHSHSDGIYKRAYVSRGH